MYMPQVMPHVVLKMASLIYDKKNTAVSSIVRGISYGTIIETEESDRIVSTKTRYTSV